MLKILSTGIAILLAFGLGSFFGESQFSSRDSLLRSQGQPKAPLGPPRRMDKPVLTGYYDPPSTIPVTGRKEIVNEEGDTVYEDFVLDPFEIVKSSPNHDWTGVNIVKPEQIDKIAHNDAERDRLIKETIYTPQRQLIYQKVSVQDRILASIANGQDLTTIIIPGLDGEELEVVITDLTTQPGEGDVTEGYLGGHLATDPESVVSWGYYDGVESGSVFSQKEGLHLEFSPREERQLILSTTDFEALNAYEDHFTEPEDEPAATFDPLGVGEESADFSQYRK